MPTISNKLVGPVGLGLAKLTTPPNFPTENQAIECLRTAAELDCLVWNAGEFYGPRYYNSLVLLERFFTLYPQYADKVVLNIKGAMLPTFTPSGDPEVIRKSVENCVEHLGGKKSIDMFETARVVADVPLETQMYTLNSLVGERKIHGVALTEVSANTIERAAKLVHIKAIEVELSLWCTDPLHNGILSTCKRFNIPVMA
jgi:pyridoxine 4-dehydrogenase